MAICPQGAIIHPDFPTGYISPVKEKLIPTFDQILELLRTRRSIRAFADRPVEKDTIEKVIEGARFAPSANNLQTTEFVVVQDRKVIDKVTELTLRYLTKTTRRLRNPLLRRLFILVARDKSVSRRLRDFNAVIEAAKKGDDLILHNAPVLLVFHGEKDVGGSDVNASLALQNATLVIHGLGLGCFYAGYMVAASKRDGSIRRLLGIPGGHEIFGCLAVGYPRVKFSNWVERRPPRIKWLWSLS